jgi:hypothetical protein
MISVKINAEYESKEIMLRAAAVKAVRCAQPALIWGEQHDCDIAPPSPRTL